MHKYVVTNQNDKIVNWKNNWEINWGNNWKLDSANVSSIDHFLEGCILYWTKNENEIKIKRVDAFTLDGKIYWAYEERFIKDILQCRGGVYIFDKGEIKYKRLVYLSQTKFEKNIIDEPEPKILYYEIEIFDKGKHISTYRSNYNQLDLNEKKDKFELQRTPKDLELIFGKDILKIKITE